MSAIVERYGADSQVRDGSSAAPSWTVAAVTLDEAAAEWRALERDGLATPYQRFDWVAAFVRHAMPASEGFRVARIADPSDRTLALLPLSISSQGGFRIAGFAGGKHANFHMAVMHPHFVEQAGPAEIVGLLRQAARALGGVDAFVFRNQPVIWDGRANPFAMTCAQPSPSPAYRLPLLADCEATLQASMSAHARKKHKNKRARFAEMGASRLLTGETAQEREAILATFLQQKARRFAELGVANPFAGAGIRQFLREASDDRGAALSLYALELNGQIVATYVGAVHAGRFSGMATSFAPDAGVSKVSPGEILLVELIRRECQLGRKMFDLGVGEARYKTSICNETEALADSFVPVTLKGRLAAAAARQAGALKRWAKANGAIRDAVGWLRARRAA